MIVINEEFTRQIETFIMEYPNFQKVTESGCSYLKGILDIPDDEGNIAGCFSIEIFPTKGFPYAFPKLYEVGGDIPCEADWHKYPDNSCCLTVSAKEKLICKNGISLLQFVSDIVIPYFANQLYRIQTGKYLQEYSHGEVGIWEFYKELFQSDDYSIWKRCLEGAFGKANFERNGKCYCNSGKKYKKCHLTIENEIRAIGKEQIIVDFKLMRLI